MKKVELNNVNSLIRLAKRATPPTSGIPLKIAVLGTDNIQYLTIVLRYVLWQSNINAEIYEGNYNGIALDILDNESDLYKFRPNICVIIPSYVDIKKYPDLLSDNESVRKNANECYIYYSMLWGKLAKINCHVFQADFVVPPIDSLGAFSASVSYSRTNYLKYINFLLAEKRPMYVNIIPFDELASNIGKKDWYDYTAYFTSKQGYSLQYVGYVADLIANQIKDLAGFTKKCLVLDLDNTLWGGVVGDDGWEGIQLDPNNAVGEAYRFFQNYIKSLKERGVLLAVCSKNDEDKAKEPFEKNPDMIIKLSDISCFIANWEDKASNISRIAKEMNIGIDSLVFCDDNPAEREIVREYLPQVEVIELPDDPALYAKTLSDSHCFDKVGLTKEDLVRSDSYVANTIRDQLEQNFVNYDDYLQALDMTGLVSEPLDRENARFSQLINKSNQFNLTTRRYSEIDIENLKSCNDVKLVAVRLKDKFTDYGLISCAIIKKYDNVAFLDTWLMSCRVMKRGVEKVTLNAVVEASKLLGCKTIIGEYIPSAKNSMVKDFYPKMNFKFTDKNIYENIDFDDNSTIYSLQVDEYPSLNTFIKVENE